jgi:HD superfamily phosphohydrolase YqeK
MDIQYAIKELLSHNNIPVYDTLVKLDYFNSPASSNKHLAIKGGLALHSYNVYLIMKDMNNKYNLNIDERSIVIISLLHDICKCNTYVENILKTTGKISESKPYIHDDKLPIGHGEKSVIMLLRLGITLTDEEMMAIRYHIGPYSQDMTNWNYTMDSIDNAGFRTIVMTTHLADMIASQLLEYNELYFGLYTYL